MAAGLDRRRQPGAGLPGPGRGRCASCATPSSTGSPTSWTAARAAQDWADWTSDQRWTLARVAALIHRLFGVSYTLRGASYLLHRIGWTPQVPTRRAVERDEDAIAAWRATTCAKVRG